LAAACWAGALFAAETEICATPWLEMFFRSTTTPTRSFYLHNAATGGAYRVRSEPGIRTFDDRNSFWNTTIPDEGVKTPGVGVVVDLKNISSQGVAQISVSAAKNAPAQQAAANGSHGRH